MKWNVLILIGENEGKSVWLDIAECMNEAINKKKKWALAYGWDNVRIVSGELRTVGDAK